MKHIYTLIISLLVSFSSFSQSPNFTLSFEDTTVIQQVYYTDSVLDPAGIWQIGKPNKPLFDSAYLSNKAVVTLLDSVLQPDSRGSFVIITPPSYYPQGSILTFVHKYNFDSTQSGGYVEFSVDSGRHWHGVSKNDTLEYTCGLKSIDIDGVFINPPTWWSSIHMDTTLSGIPYITGTDSIWTRDTIVMPILGIGKTYQNNLFLFKFTAFADSNSSPTAGWMIDNIEFQMGVLGCGGGIDEINSSHLNISPNPATSGFHIALTGETGSEYIATLYDLTGREMMQKNFTGNETTLRRDGLATGSYLVKVTNRRTLDTFEKRVIFE